MSDKDKKTINENDALLETAAGVKTGKDKDGKWHIAPLTMRSVLLLEKVGSPFIIGPQPIYDADGTPRMQMVPIYDPNGSPVMEGDKPMMKPEPMMMPVTPTMEDIIKAFWVLTHAESPTIMETFRNQDEMERELYVFSGQLQMADVTEIGSQLNKRVSELNDASGGLDSVDTVVKKATGPSDT